MCEFKVKVLENGEEKEIAENILFSTIENSKLIFRNILGMTKTVENALITEISVPSEKILLMKSDLIPPFYDLIQLIAQARDQKEIVSAWKQLKNIGDAMFGA